ncbi:hypothetical protein GA0070213_12730, partial [Micromonospora humi]
MSAEGRLGWGPEGVSRRGPWGRQGRRCRAGGRGGVRAGGVAPGAV